MRICITAPKVDHVRTGNHCTAQQWAAILTSLGHELELGDGQDLAQCDLLLALHAVKSHEVIREFRTLRPGKPVVLALTGTDIYPAPGVVALESMELADALVVLQPHALRQIPEQHRNKTRVIVQSVQQFRSKPQAAEITSNADEILVCVAGHLRDVKDPLRAAKAARLLPATSKIRIEHAGAVLDPKYHALVKQEQKENPRYTFLGEQTCAQVQELMHRSHVMVLSSYSEGGARVIGESTVEGTPVLATRIDGVTGLTGDDYPGLFAPGSTPELAALLQKFENDGAFLLTLHAAVDRIAPRFDPSIERDLWAALINDLVQ